MAERAIVQKLGGSGVDGSTDASNGPASSVNDMSTVSGIWTRHVHQLLLGVGWTPPGPEPHKGAHRWTRCTRRERFIANASNEICTRVQVVHSELPIPRREALSTAMRWRHHPRAAEATEGAEARQLSLPRSSGAQPERERYVL